MSNCSLKQKCVFVIGFFIGFTIAILIFVDDNEIEHNGICKRKYTWLCNGEKHPVIQKLQKSVNVENLDFSSRMRENGLKIRENVSYEKWLKKENMHSVRIDLDNWQYGPELEKHADRNILLEADWLKSRVHVTCVVYVEKLKRAKSIRDSWGMNCNRLYFFSQHTSDEELLVLKFPSKLTSSWQLLCESMNYVWKYGIENNDTRNRAAVEWVVFVKDDTMVVAENLRYLVAPLDFNEAHYLGHPVVLWGQAYNVAQAGFVLSKAAFQKIIEKFDTHEKCASGGRYWKKEDYYLGKHLATFGIHPADTRDRYMRDIFHGYSLQTLLWGIARPGSYFTRALYPPGRDCCSPKSITFSTAEPDKMYTINYMLYHLNVYTGPGIYGSNPAPTPVPEEEVWRSALREEFNITDFHNVNSDRYYEIWRSRYSGPEQLIRKNNKTLSNARRFLPSNYRSRSILVN